MDNPDLESFPLIQTKLHQPVQSTDPVQRPRLTNWLNQRRGRPLTLVSAPAGYGKSTLVSEWIQSLDYPTAWVSLDRYDNDLGVFLSYFVAAIQSIFPDKLIETLALLRASELPPLRYLVSSMVNELDKIGEEYVLVLDDYYLIELQVIHDLVNELIQYAPEGMHLVLCTRVDPPLPLVKLRAKSQMAEIRGQDLCFTEDEGYLLVQQILENKVDRTETDSLVAQSEGWVTGIRLAALALRHRKGVKRTEVKLTANNRYVMEYLVSEILENQMAEFTESLLKTSILERLCTGLFEAVCDPEDGSGEPEIDGRVFLDWLEASNLFVIQLDDQGEWVRYHRLFQDFLQSELAHRYSTEEIANFHCRASEWYAHEGLLDEAIRHALIAGDANTAAQFVEENTYKILRTGLFHTLERWLDQLPDEVGQRRPKLLLAKAWVSIFQGKFEKIPTFLQTLDALLETDPLESNLQGDLDHFNGVLLFWDWQIKASVELFHRAVAGMSSENVGGRNEAELYFACASLMAGNEDEVIHQYRQMLENETVDSPRYGYLLGTLAFVYLLSGNLAMVYEFAQQMAAFGDRMNNSIVGGWGSYLMGHMNFEWDNLETACHHFAKAVAKRYFLDINTPIDSYAGLIFSYQALGQPDKANKTADLMVEFAQESNNPFHFILARSVQARFSLLQGDRLSAIRWLETEDSLADVGTMFFWLEQPRITRCRVLIAQGTKDTLREAAQKLQEYWVQNQATHNTPRMIEVLLLQSLVFHKLGQLDETLATLEKVLNLARPGVYIRPFVELGPEFVTLFNQLRHQGVTPDYIDLILAAFLADENKPEEIPIHLPSQTNNLVEPLTKREFEILELLGKRFTNKEIAAELYVSVGTVQQHLNHIYAKLNVKGRRQAVAKATELAILSPRG